MPVVLIPVRTRVFAVWLMVFRLIIERTLPYDTCMNLGMRQAEFGFTISAESGEDLQEHYAVIILKEMLNR